MPAPSDPTFRVPLSEADLRDVKADAIERIAEGGRKFGGEPNIANIERFVDPIVEKIDRDHGDNLRKGVEPGTRKRVAADGETAVERRGMGEFDFTTRQFTPSAAGASELNRRAAPESLNTRAVRRVVQEITNNPERAEPWKRLLMAARLRPLPPGHHDTHCLLCEGSQVCLVRETALRAIVQRYMARFGDPRPAIVEEDRQARKRHRAALRGLRG